MNQEIIKNLIEELYQGRKELGDIFYSDISQRMKSAKIKDSSGNIFCSICNELNQRGLKTIS